MQPLCTSTTFPLFLSSRKCTVNSICLYLWSLAFKRKSVSNIWFYFFHCLSQGTLLVTKPIYSSLILEDLLLNLTYFGLMGVLCWKLVLFEILVSLKMQYLMLGCLVISWLCTMVSSCTYAIYLKTFLVF